jgi:hypothetical protein
MRSPSCRRCHSCAGPLLVHGHSVTEGYQSEEKGCRARGEIERRAFRLHLEEPPEDQHGTENE